MKNLANSAKQSGSNSIFKKVLKKVMNVLFGKSTNAMWKYLFNYFVNTHKVRKNWVLYESHAGAGMLCNPLALFKEFQKRPDFKKYLHIWVIADKDEMAYLKKKYSRFRNVKFVRYNTIGYAFHVATAKYLINNTSFTSFFYKRKEQIYLNTWHSITVKYIGYDIPDGKRYVQNMLRNLLMADYIVSPNKFMTGIFNESYKLKELYDGKIIEEGYPQRQCFKHSKGKHNQRISQPWNSCRSK